MNLSVKDVADILSVSSKTIYRMIKSEAIPCFRVGGQWRFDRREIVSWLEDKREFAAKSALISGGEEDISIADLIARGGVYSLAGCASKEQAIRAGIGMIRSVRPADAEDLFASVMEREALCPTSVGNGVATPHPRAFGRFADRPLIALCRLGLPVDFHSLDCEPVDTLVFIFPSTERLLLMIQAKLMRLLREDSVLSAFKSGNADVVMAVAEREAGIFGCVMQNA